MNTSSNHKLGFWMLTALVTGNMIGSGVFLLPATLAQYGSISFFAWLLTATGAILLALVFAKLGQISPQLGGPYAYCRIAFGDFVGFLVAYTYWIGLWVGNGAIVLAFLAYLSIFFPALANNHMISYCCAVGTIWLLTFVNIRGVQLAGKLQLLTTILKLFPLILLSIVGIFFINWHNFSAFNVSGHSGAHALMSAAALTLWAFIGLESASIPANDIDNPESLIPKSTITGTLLAATVYIVSTMTVMGLIPMLKLAQSNAPYADAAAKIFGLWGKDFVAIGAIISCFGALNGWILLQGQIPRAAANDKLFPERFSQLSRWGTPYIALLISAICITCLLLLTINDTLVHQFSFIIALAVFATLIPYLLCSMAKIMIIMKTMDTTTLAFRRSCLIAVLAFIYSFWTVICAGREIVYYGTLLTFSGVPIYVWMQWRQHQG